MSTITFVEAKPKDAWYNFKNQQYEYLAETPSDLSDYIPQDPIAQNMYQLYLEVGVKPTDAAIKILNIMTGNKE